MSIGTAERRETAVVKAGRAMGKVRGRPHIFCDEVLMARASSGNSSPAWESLSGLWR